MTDHYRNGGDLDRLTRADRYHDLAVGLRSMAVLLDSLGQKDAADKLRSDACAAEDCAHDLIGCDLDDSTGPRVLP